MVDAVKTRTRMKLKFGDWILVPSNYFEEDNDIEPGPSKYIGKIISRFTGDSLKVQCEIDGYTSIVKYADLKGELDYKDSKANHDKNCNKLVL